MNFRSKETKILQKHPVRFYKIVALGFLSITIILFVLIMLMSSKRATVIVLTKDDSIEVSGTLHINSDEGNSRIEGDVVTSSIKISETFEPTGTREEIGTSTGIITIHNEGPTDQPLVIKTRFLTEDGILFRLTKGVIVPANGTLDAQVYADKEGPESDIPPSQFSIPGLSQARQKIVYGVSAESMTGGKQLVGVLTTDDLSAAEKVIKDKLLEKGEQQLETQNEERKGAFELSDVHIISNAQTDTEVSEFTLTGTATIVGAFYDQDSVKEFAKRLLQTYSVDDISIIKSSDTDPVVELKEYDLEKNTASLDIKYTGFATLDTESKQLDKLIFYGKTADEVRRYLLSLPHVYGVETEFKPRWIHTVPHVADHVTIIVKNVE